MNIIVHGYFPKRSKDSKIWTGSRKIILTGTKFNFIALLRYLRKRRTRSHNILNFDFQIALYMENDKKILMVCLGNICRSPLAQGVMEHKIQSLGLQNWFIDSAGTGRWHVGNPPDPRSISTARKHGLDISNQRARQFSLNDFENFDVIIAMDQQNKKDLLNLATTKQQKSKVVSLMEIAYNSTEDVPDPYYDGRFEEVYNILDGSVDKAIDFLKNGH